MLLMKSFQLLSASSYRMVMVDAGIQLRDAYSVLEGSGGGGSPPRPLIVSFDFRRVPFG